MNRIKAFGGFWYDFIVGDDWRVAVAVVAALAITSGLSSTAVPAWWVLPATVAILNPAPAGVPQCTSHRRTAPGGSWDDHDGAG